MSPLQVLQLLGAMPFPPRRSEAPVRPETQAPEPAAPRRHPADAHCRLFVALDANGDGTIDADEIANAPAVLRSLDRDGDGQLDREELHLEP